VTPEVALAPLVGWDREGYLLGYGGRQFVRTFAAVAAPLRHRHRPAGGRTRDDLPAAARHPPRRDPLGPCEL